MAAALGAEEPLGGHSRGRKRQGEPLLAVVKASRRVLRFCHRKRRTECAFHKNVFCDLRLEGSLVKADNPPGLYTDLGSLIHI